MATTTQASRIPSVDPHPKTVKFDIGHHSQQIAQPGKLHDVNEAVNVAIRANPPKEWELDVRSLISSKKWLQNYGLKKYRLQLHHILASIGFKLSDGYDETLKKPVSSRYGGGLFRHLMRADGKTFNIACSRDKLMQLEKRLLQAIYLFRRRLEWLTTESRRVFGVIEERSITIILDIRNMSLQQFDQYKKALERVLREQVSRIAKFNLIRASEDLQCYSPTCVSVSHDTIESAIKWVWELDRLAQVANTSAAEAIFAALKDQHNEAIYLFTEGTSIDCGKEVLKEKISNTKLSVPVNAVSFNCDNSDTVKFLKDFVKTTRGKFHCYAVVMELDAYEVQPPDGNTARANILLRRKTFGGIPFGAGCREDVVLVFEEMEEARNNLAQVRLLIEKTPDCSTGSDETLEDLSQNSSLATRNEQYMNSQEWLEIYGLDARKLGLYDVLSGVAFKHQDGVINVMSRSVDKDQTDAVVQEKLVNARYCDRFPVVRWKDGHVVHVQVTPEVYRGYEEKIRVAMNAFQQRIDWLNQGSRALFGTICEDMMYILIDTSASMKPSLGFVKQKLFVLMQEQLRHKKKINIVAYNSKAVAWKDRLVEVSEASLQGAWQWVQNLSTWGSTNTYAAIQMAMGDPNTQAIYLLSDGRPDQPPRSIIAQVHMKKYIPIHTISFNCEDSEANHFLYDLANATGGRYHYYNDKRSPINQPESWESVDIKLLKEEKRKGCENLEKLANLRDECNSIALKKDTEETKRDRKYVHPHSGLPRPSSAGPLMSKSSRSDSPPVNPSLPCLTPKSNNISQSPNPSTGDSPKRLPKRPKSAKVSVCHRPMMARHTRTTMLRTLSSSGRFSPNEWLLPETKTIIEEQSKQTDTGKSSKCEQVKIEQKKAKRSKKKVKANQMSSKQWLAKNGLVAKRLTILDALGSTFVHHKPKYVSILDKNVMSKVFDDVLPIAHISRNQQVKLVNPNGINLHEYEMKVQKALNKFKIRLNTIVWNGLSADDKNKFESDVPIDFEDNKKAILECLDESDWPVKEQDINLLTKEIARAEKFLNQSQALRLAANGKDADLDTEEVKTENEDDISDKEINVKNEDGMSDKEINVKDDNEMSDKEINVKDEDGMSDKEINVKDEDGRSDKEINVKDEDCMSDKEDISRSSPGPDLASGRSHNSESNKSVDSELPPRKAVKQSKERRTKKSKSVILGKEAAHTADKSVQGKVKETSDVTKAKVRIKLDTLRGQRVIARKDQDGLYYPAVVMKCADPRHATVKYDDGTVVDVLTRNVIPTGGAVARPQLVAGDCVLMRVINLDLDEECFVPAVIQVGPQRAEVGSKFYTVVMYNGQKASTLRTYLVKISKERFELSSMYIADQQNENRKHAEDLVYVRSTRKSKREQEGRNERAKQKKKTKSRSPSSDESYPSSRKSRSIEKERQQRQPQSRSRSNSPITIVRSKSLSRSTSRSRSRSSSDGYVSKASTPRNDISQIESPRRDSEAFQRESESRITSPSRSPQHSHRDSDVNKSPKQVLVDHVSDQSGSNTRRSGEITPRIEDEDDFFNDENPPHLQGNSPEQSDDQLLVKSEGEVTPILSDIESGVHTPLPRSPEKSPDRQSVKSHGSRSSDLERLRQELLEQQERQERQKKKLKKKSKQLAAREQELQERREEEEKERDAAAIASEKEAIPKLIQLRKNLNHVRPGEEVLARWSDDGWYYRGIVRQYHGDCSYNIEDSTGFVERIWREDIISENDNPGAVYEVDDCVVALHPDYSFSYAPGHVSSTIDGEVEVLLYDGKSTMLPWNEVYHVINEKHAHDVTYITKREKELVGAAVVARDNSTGCYFPGSVKRKVEGKCEYLIGWSDRSDSVQLAIHIFSAFTRRRPLALGDRVLAMSDPVHVMFLPGIIIGADGGKLKVKFCDGEMREGVDPTVCYWLGQRYYDASVKYFRLKEML